ncbi:hypothetical protein L6452_24713 [Arctium lappa]|uniref:Uncharacterized protein n=1 Tax=Arctium lappa TaxID=4217 RepID=A0ACB9AA04_ARCLA|nr:hypothetical protein L6452_24713 [Arctium lappa]
MESGLPRHREVLFGVLDGAEWRVELVRSSSRMALVMSSGLVEIAARGVNDVSRVRVSLYSTGTRNSIIKLELDSKTRE